MITPLLKLILGTKSQRDIKKLKPLVEQINVLETKYEAFSDDDLRGMTVQFRNEVQGVVNPLYAKIDEAKQDRNFDEEELSSLEKNVKKELEAVLNKILPDAFAVVREAGKRALEMRHYDVQLMGGIVLHQGKIAEMTTGEGKTLVATLPAYLNALAGRGSHVVTVNDYLAERDRDWMGAVYEFLGLTVGCIKHGINTEERRRAYNCDITYGTNNEFGFDYLRDNMVSSLDERVQRDRHYCIVDEVDSILIDEARTPLIISGAVETISYCYDEIKSKVRDLVGKQSRLIDDFIKNLDNAIKSENSEDIKKWLYLIHRGAPKDKVFLTKIINDPSLKKTLEQITVRYAAKDMVEDRLKLEEDLFYTYEEKTREVVLTNKGESDLSNNYPGQFELEDITAIVSDIQGDESLSDEEKAVKEKAVYDKYEDKGKRIRSFDQLLKAYVLFQIDVDYVVKDNKVVIVDEFTGRMMEGRRFSDGLHEALEAKENVKIQRESQTLASITFQNYFRMYSKLSGMTGTADTEAGEFDEIYKLDVVVIPTNRPLQRKSDPDVIYKTEKEKFNAIAQEVEELNAQGRPVLVGTVSIDKSEKLSALLKRRRVLHEVLNAKNHSREADIITLAGQSGSITIATNMAGRGTDIKLGDAVADKGGLHIIGTERHESRRVDNQLRGRSGRQGDPGSSRFYLSLEDDLMRVFGSDRIASVMERLGLEEGQDIQHPLITRAIGTAQKRVENHNFEIRKWLLKYDDIMNKQREVIYSYRDIVLEDNDLTDYVFDSVYETLDYVLDKYYECGDEIDFTELSEELFSIFHIVFKEDFFEGRKREEVYDGIIAVLEEEFDKKKNSIDEESFLMYLRWRLLEVVDRRWKDHLYAMDELRESVGLRAWGQVDPLLEYKKEGHKMFAEMMGLIKYDSAKEVFSMPVIHVADEVLKQSHFDIADILHPEVTEQQRFAPTPEETVPQSLSSNSGPSTFIRKDEKVGRNDPCTCGSGRKYKKCCGK